MRMVSFLRIGLPLRKKFSPLGKYKPKVYETENFVGTGQNEETKSVKTPARYDEIQKFGKRKTFSYSTVRNNFLRKKRILLP